MKEKKETIIESDSAYQIRKERDTEMKNFKRNQFLIMSIVVVIVMVPLYYSIIRIFSIQNELYNVVKAVRFPNNQIEFRNLVTQTLSLVEKYYYPNLTFESRYVPQKMRTVINDNLANIQRIINKKEANPKDLPEYYLLMGLYYCGNVATYIEDIGNAVSSFEKYLQLRPYDVRVLTNLGLCYAYGLKNFRKALEFYEEAFEFNPGYCRAHYNKAIALWELQRREDAISEINNLIKNRPDCAEAFFVMSLIQYGIGNIENTISFLNQAVDNGFDDISWLRTTSFYNKEFRMKKEYKNAEQKILRRRFIGN